MSVDKSVEQNDDVMEEDVPAPSEPLSKNVVIEPKFKIPKINPISLQKFFDKTRDREGNIRLSCVNKMYKKSKKKQRKLGMLLFDI
jgi:hypothetical protein